MSNCRQAEERAQTSEAKRSELEITVREQAEKIRALERQVSGQTDVMEAKPSVEGTADSTNLQRPSATLLAPAEGSKVSLLKTKRLKSPKTSPKTSPRSMRETSLQRSTSKSPRKGGGSSSSQGSAKKK